MSYIRRREAREFGVGKWGGEEALATKGVWTPESKFYQCSAQIFEPLPEPTRPGEEANCLSALNRTLRPEVFRKKRRGDKHLRVGQYPTPPPEKKNRRGVQQGLRRKVAVRKGECLVSIGTGSDLSRKAGPRGFFEGLSWRTCVGSPPEKTPNPSRNSEPVLG